jgi:hypothetical protein
MLNRSQKHMLAQFSHSEKKVTSFKETNVSQVHTASIIRSTSTRLHGAISQTAVNLKNSTC